MKKQTKSVYSIKSFTLILLILITLGFIWGNSLLSGDISGENALAVMDYLNRLLNFLHLDFLEVTDVYWIRKAAHVTEFFVLGLELSVYFVVIRKKAYTAPLLFGLLSAVTDETIQSYVGGRSSLVMDIWIDFAGTALAVLILYLIRGKRRR